MSDLFERISSPENLWRAWVVYRRGKRRARVVRIFERHLEEELVSIRTSLLDGTYEHGDYEHFVVHDPKKRTISVPTVRDHVVHQAVMNILAPIYERIFLPMSFSCRKNKGTHRAIALFESFLRAQARSHTRRVWILHGDVQKCFDSIDHTILASELGQHIRCEKTRTLLVRIIKSYAPGIPLGNVTSQLFVNAYLDPLDRFIKYTLRVKRYLRYADDFLLVGDSEAWCKIQ